MDRILIIAGTLFTLAVGVATAFSDTRTPASHSSGRFRRLTRSGWIALVCLCIGAAVTIYAGFRQSRESDEATRRAKETLREATQARQQAEATKADTQKLAVSLWREQHPFGQVKTRVQMHLDLPANQPPPVLGDWLRRVTRVYLTQPMSHVLGSGSPQNSITINRQPGANLSLMPRGASEALVDKIFFHPYCIVLVSHEPTTVHLLAPSLAFQTQFHTVTVIFDSVSKRPNAVDAEAEGDGEFNPIAGELTNWLDFYGATITYRLNQFMGGSTTGLDRLRLQAVSFQSSSTAWNARADIFPDSPAEAHLIVHDAPGSLTILSGDWHTLGVVPADYPGPRPPGYGTPSSPQ